MSIATQIFRAVGNLLSSFFEDDMEVISPEARRILSNRHDAKLYVDAIEKLKSDDVDSVAITLSTGEEIKLI